MFCYLGMALLVSCHAHFEDIGIDEEALWRLLLLQVIRAFGDKAGLAIAFGVGREALDLLRARAVEIEAELGSFERIAGAGDRDGRLGILLRDGKRAIGRDRDDVLLFAVRRDPELRDMVPASCLSVMRMRLLGKRPGQIGLFLRAVVEGKATLGFVALLREVALIHPDCSLGDGGCALRVERLSAERAVQGIAVGDEPAHAMRVSAQCCRVHLADPVPFGIGDGRPSLLRLGAVAAAAVRALDVRDEGRWVVAPDNAPFICFGRLGAHEPQGTGSCRKADGKHEDSCKLPPCGMPSSRGRKRCPSCWSLRSFRQIRMRPLSVRVHACSFRSAVPGSGKRSRHVLQTWMPEEPEIWQGSDGSGEVR